MELRKSGKLAIGIIAAAGTIGALHWFIFKDRAADYEAKHQKFQSAISQSSAQGAPPRVNDIFAFRYKTLKYDLEFWETVEQLGVFIPEYHMPDADGNMNEPLQQEKLWDIYRALQERRAAAEASDDAIDMTFMGELGWNFSGLPEELASNQIATEDLLTNLSNENQLLKSINPDQPVYQQRLATYNQLLARLGLNLNMRTYLEDRYGQLFSALFTMNRIDNVMEDLPPDYFRNARMTDEQALDAMYELFRLEWPKDFTGNVAYYMAQRQGDALLTAIDIAEEEEIEDVVRVVFYDYRPIYWREPVDESEATPTPDFGMGMMGEEFMMMGAGDPGFGGMGQFGRFGGGGFGMPTPTPDEAFDAIGAPMEIWVRGPNSAVMSFFYRLSNSEHPFELDRVRLFTLEDQEGSVFGVAYLNVVTYAQAVGVMTDTDVQKKVVEAKRNLYEVAVRPGAGELAVEDGIATKSGVTFELTVPMPTPWPGEPDTVKQNQAPVPEDMPSLPM